MSVRRARQSPLAAPRLPTELAEAEPTRDDLVDDAVLSRLALTGVDWRERSARIVDLEESRLTGVALTGSRLDKLTVSDSTLQRCDLANVQLSHGSMTRVSVSDSRLTGMTAAGAIWRHVRLADCLADLSAFRFASFTRVEFVDCRLRGADFESAELNNTIFRRCDLTAAEFSQAKTRGTTFVDCTWDGIRGVTSLAGSTIATSSPLDLLSLTAILAGALGIKLADTEAVDAAAADAE